jgi:lysophospholipase L1-like esterase
MHKILLAGSSIFEAWAQAQDVVPGRTVVNRAVGGTTTQYWKDHLADVMATESPHVVLFYCGSNDLNQDIPEAAIVDNVAQCRVVVRRQSPTCLFAYFGIIKAPQKDGKWDLIDRLNGAVRTVLLPHDLYVETNAVLFREGLPVGRLFLEDGLHLTEEAYALLSLYARPILSDWIGA